MSKRLTKENLTPEQWSAILSAINKEKIEKEERKLALELKKYEAKLALQQKYSKAKNDDKDIIDELYKLYYGLDKKTVENLQKEDDGSKALGFNDEIDKINRSIKTQQYNVYQKNINQHLENKDDSFYTSQNFLNWAESNLGKTGDMFGTQYDFNFTDNNLEPGELDLLKQNYKNFLLDKVSNEDATDGFLPNTDIWNQIDLNQYLNNPDYVATSNRQDTLGIQIDYSDLPNDENLVEVMSKTNSEILNSQLFQTRLNKLKKTSMKLFINNESLLKDEYPALHKNNETIINNNKAKIQNNVLPKFKDSGIEVDDDFIKKEIKDSENEVNKPLSEFNFDKATSYMNPNIFSSDTQNEQYAYGKIRHPLGTPKLPAEPIQSPKDSRVTTSSFASNKSKIDWTKVEGKKWYEKA